MKFHEFLIRPLTHRWVEINRTTERVVSETWLSNVLGELDRLKSMPRLLAAPVKANARRTGGRAKRHLIAAE